MPQRFCLLLVLLGILIPAGAQSPARAQSTRRAQSATQPVIRYHFGDNPAWAAPSFNDSAWPVAQNGRWPVPRSGGVIWLRMKIPVPPSSNTPLAVMLENSHRAQQLYFQGRLIGQYGQLPPHRVAVLAPTSSVTAVPNDLVSEPVANIAIRIWYFPSIDLNSRSDTMGVQLGPEQLLQAKLKALHLSALFRLVPLISLDVLYGLVGLALLMFCYWFRRREIFWFSFLLITIPFLDLAEIFLPQFVTHPINLWFYGVPVVLFDAVTMFVSVEFLYALFHLRARSIRILLHLAWILFNVGLLIVLAVDFSSVSTATFFAHLTTLALTFFNFGIFFICIRYFITGPNRAIAFSVALFPLGSELNRSGIHPTLFHIRLFDIGFILAGFGIAALLVQQAIAAWRQGELLRGEIAAAREVQQRLVPQTLPLVPGLQLNAAYLPAAEVGGDFYQVFPLPDGSALVVVADVSGKGLKAAMTGTVALGALRLLANESRSPSYILTRLNAELAKSPDGGFITCLCAHLAPNGTLTVANAGHLSPYRNGEEIPLDSGLPLGITEAAEYPQTTLQLNPGDQLTFLSDGVIEARNPSGELYGFDRTQAISQQTAEQIAHAASAFGQEDDITVLTLTLAPA